MLETVEQHSSLVVASGKVSAAGTKRCAGCVVDGRARRGPVRKYLFAGDVVESQCVFLSPGEQRKYLTVVVELDLVDGRGDVHNSFYGSGTF